MEAFVLFWLAVLLVGIIGRLILAIRRLRADLNLEQERSKDHWQGYLARGIRLNELKKLIITDENTMLLNRSGFELFVGHEEARAIAMQSPNLSFCMISVNLQKIPEDLHDAALKAVARVLRASTPCFYGVAYLGFGVVAICVPAGFPRYSEERCESIRAMVRGSLAEEGLYPDLKVISASSLEEAWDVILTR
jgi:GGDEF domain-containing protein